MKTQEELMEGFKRGMTLVVDRRDNPNLPWLMRQVNAGVLEYVLVQYDEQSSAYKFRLKDETRRG